MSKKIRRIDGEQRFYDIPQVGLLPSVTTIQGIIAKPALIGWAKKEVALAIQPILRKLYQGKLKPEDLDVEAILKMAKERPAKKTKEAGDIGTRAHEIVALLVKREMRFQTKWSRKGIYRYFKKSDNKKVRNCVDAFIDWAKFSDFIPIVSEKIVYSKKRKYAGTLDTKGYVGGELTIIDFKSSKKYYPENALQLIAYNEADAEMGNEKATQAIVVRLGKTDGEFEVIKIKNHRKHLSAFMNALNLWKWKQTLGK